MSNSKDYTIRIADMLSAIEEIEDFCRGMDCAAFKNNKTTQRAVERCCEIIGEASNFLPDDFKAALPDVPWPFIRGLRNIIAHEYGRVDYAILWTIVDVDLPRLKTQLAPHDPRSNKK